VGAVDDEVLGSRGGGVIHGEDRLLDRVAARKPPVGLDREADDDREPRRSRGPHDPDGLLRVREGESSRLRTPGLRERADLHGVVPLSFIRIHQECGVVGVAAGPDGPFDDDVAAFARFEHVVAHAFDERNGAPVDLHEVVALVAEQPSPVGIGAPRGRRQDERHAAVPRELEERLVVALQRSTTLVAVDERERRELW
jgi:hypothetical protein